MGAVVLIGAGVFVTLCLGVYWLGSGPLGAMEKLPIATIARTPENVDVRVSGSVESVRDIPLLEAPLSGRACVAWHVLVEERKRSTDLWSPVIDETDTTPFSLIDPTGRAIVDGPIRMKLFPDATGGNVPFEAPSDRLEPFMTSRGKPMTGMLLEKRLRFREGIIEVGERVTVAGSCRWEADPSALGGGFRSVGRVLRVRAASTGELWVTDRKALTSLSVASGHVRSK